MRKLFVFICCLFPVYLTAGEPLMLVKPSREIFVNFPSAILPDKAVSVFLPEPAVPLHAQYPVVYLLGAVPTDKDAAQALLGRSTQKAILVGLNVTDAELADTSKIVQFFSRELIPYIATNYPTLDQPAFRVIAAKGDAGAKVLAALTARKNLFNSAVILNSSTPDVSPSGHGNALRMIAAGTQAEAAIWAGYLEQKGFHYGPGFITRIAASTSLFDVLDLDYLFADAEELEVAKLEGNVTPKTISIAQNEPARASFTAWLGNGMHFDFVPSTLRLAPPYVTWDPSQGTLTPIAGATVGTVKISAVVDKIEFHGKIKLKK